MKTLLSDKVYEVLKWLCVLALPAVAEFIEGLFPLWGIPYADPIGHTIRLVSLLIGVLIGISTIDYNQKLNAELNTIKNDIEDK